MALVRGQAALGLTGTLPAHSECFQKVADAEKCVISSRAVGKQVTGLLAEGYATKGFHNKAKSCKWGPMAGFVLADPRFGKLGSAREPREGQRKALIKALGCGAGETPLYISEQRRVELLKPSLDAMREGWQVDYHNHYYFADSPSGELLLFHLQRTDSAPGANGKMLWAVHYGLTEKAMTSGLTGPDGAEDLDYQPVMAMVDPSCPASVGSTYRAATTGDYDLFAVFPLRRKASPRDQDKRPVSGSERHRVPIREFSTEDPHLGNITPRVKEIRRQVNALANYPGGDIVHHSDEGGRPCVDDMDFPCIAWVPGEMAPYGLASVADFKQLIAELGTRYFLMLNPGWYRELGIGTTPMGSYEV